VAVNTAYLLKSYSKETGTGRVVVESGFYLEREPDTVRGPDVSFWTTNSPRNSYPSSVARFRSFLRTEDRF